MANNYKLGNIGFDLITDPKSTFQILDKVIKKISVLKTTVNNFDTKSFKLDAQVEKLNQQLERQRTLTDKFKTQLAIVNSKLEEQKQKTEKVTAQTAKTNAQLELTRLRVQKIKQANEKPFIDPKDIEATNNQIEILRGKLNTLYENINVKRKKGLLTKDEGVQEKATLDRIKLRLDKMYDTIEYRRKNGLLKESDLISMNYQLKNTEIRINSLNSKMSGLKNGFSKIALAIGKLSLIINIIRRVATSIVNLSKKAIDFEETLNKFQVSMGDFYEESVDFVNQLTRAFNLSTDSVMNYMSTFNNMLTALGGIDRADAFGLSKTLTRMAIDYASLFNVSVDKAMEQFQAVLSGQIRNIRSTSGYDVSETTIYSIYQSLGGKKTMRQLDQIEKRLLRIIALQKQMEQTGAVDDFSKTINNSANMIKQIQETWKEIARWAGTLLLHVFEPIVESILVSSIVLREMLKSLNIALGYKYENQGGGGGLFGEITESATEAENAIKNLQASLLGFDQLNVLGGTTTTSGIGSDYQLLISQIKDYESSLSTMSSEANKRAEAILSTLGIERKITIEYDEQGNKIEKVIYKLNKTNSFLGDVKKSLEGIKKVSDFLNKPLGESTIGATLFGPVPSNGLIGVIEKISGKKFSGIDNAAEGILFALGITNVDALKNAEFEFDSFVDKITQTSLAKFILLWQKVASSFKEYLQEIKIGFVNFVNYWLEIINNYLIGGFESFLNIFVEGINLLASTKIGSKIWSGLFDETESLQRVELGRIPQLTYDNAIDNEAQTTAIVDAISNGNMQIVKALKNSNNKPIYLNGKKVSEALYNDFNNVTDRKGIGIVGMEWGGS